MVLYTRQYSTVVQQYSHTTSNNNTNSINSSMLILIVMVILTISALTVPSGGNLSVLPGYQYGATSLSILQQQYYQQYLQQQYQLRYSVRRQKDTRPIPPKLNTERDKGARQMVKYPKLTGKIVKRRRMEGKESCYGTCKATLYNVKTGILITC